MVIYLWTYIMFFRIGLLFLSYTPLAAHFLRYGNLLLAVPLALLPCLAFLRKKSIIQLLQVGLVLGVLFVWIPTAIEMTQVRVATNQPWVRMVAILSGVMLFSLGSAFLATGIHQRNNWYE